MMHRFQFVLFFLSIVDKSLPNKILTLKILHTASFHSKFEPIQFGSETRYGIARIVNFVKEEKKERNRPTLYFDTLDCFTGSIWYSIYHWEVCADFIKLLPVDALSVGDAEMRSREEGKREEIFHLFLKRIRKTVICSNCNVTNDKNFYHLIRPSTILQVGEHKRRIGVVGYIEQRISPDPFANVKFTNTVMAVCDAVKFLISKNVNIIIALGHGSLAVDKLIAKTCAGLDIIIGGHSRLFFYNGEPPVPHQKVRSVYPWVIRNNANERVLLVHPGAYGQYVGKLVVTFNAFGRIENFIGNPVYMDSTVKEDGETMALVEDYRKRTKEFTTRAIGKTRVTLDAQCAWRECNLGNLVTDAYVQYRASEYHRTHYWTDAPMALINSGAIRANIHLEPDHSTISMADIQRSLPFSDFLVCMELKGSDLRYALEYSVADEDDNNAAKFLQVSGIRVLYDFREPSYQKIISIKVRCARCETPHYNDLEDNRMYRVLMTEFLAGGGDGFVMLRANDVQMYFEQLTNTDIVEQYIRWNKHIQTGVEERISIVPDDYDLDENGTCKIDLFLYSLLLIFFYNIIILRYSHFSLRS